MNNDLTIVLNNENTENDSEQFVQVPIKKKDFGKFITNLLGQRETITNKKIGTFEASFEWLVHLHHLLDQRINQQASASLVDFSAVFSYRNAPERRLSSIDAFLAFNEAKLVTTKSVKLTWTYLLTFPNKPTPEKQEISLTLLTDRTEVVHLGATRVIRQTTNENGLIAYEISHTERTWGDDIQSLLDKETSALFQKHKWYENALTKFGVFLAFGFFLAGFIIPDFVEQSITANEVAKLYSEFLPDSNNISDLPNADKLTIILHLLEPNNQIHKVSIWYRLASFVLGIFIAVMSLSLFERDKPSHLVITSEDKKYKTKCSSKKNKSYLKKVGGFILAISAGVVGNYAYYLLTT